MQTFDKHKLKQFDSINIWCLASNSNADWKMGFSPLYLIEEVFKHKVVVVVTGGELDVLQKEPQLNVQ